jgi:hypothetical protein
VFKPWPVPVRFVLEEVLLKQVSLQVFWFSPVRYHSTSAVYSFIADAIIIPAIDRFVKTHTRLKNTLGENGSNHTRELPQCLCISFNSRNYRTSLQRYGEYVLWVVCVSPYKRDLYFIRPVEDLSLCLDGKGSGLICTEIQKVSLS